MRSCVEVAAADMGLSRRKLRMLLGAVDGLMAPGEDETSAPILDRSLGPKSWTVCTDEPAEPPAERELRLQKQNAAQRRYRLPAPPIKRAPSDPDDPWYMPESELRERLTVLALKYQVGISWDDWRGFAVFRDRRGLLFTAETFVQLGEHLDAVIPAVYGWSEAPVSA